MLIIRYLVQLIVLIIKNSLKSQIVDIQWKINMVTNFLIYLIIYLIFIFTTIIYVKEIIMTILITIK